jgi:Holliday junction resolvasome RuvABC ATP-dependent DNA helicase subunit
MVAATAAKIGAGKGKKDDGGFQFKAVLMSGPPGVGKSSSAKIIAEEMGYDVVEMNARCVPLRTPTAPTMRHTYSKCTMQCS